MNELERLEQRGWEALSGPDGASFDQELMADDGLMVFPGLLLDKAQTIRAIAAERPWASFELNDLRILQLTPDSAIVTYRAAAQREGAGALSRVHDQRVRATRWAMAPGAPSADAQPSHRPRFHRMKVRHLPLVLFYRFE